MEIEARFAIEGNNVLTKWRLKEGSQMKAEDGFGKLKLDHKIEKDTTRTG